MEGKSNMNIPTPHITAKPGDFAPTVLMPGDPLRARVIAERYLENARLVNEVRGMLAYTGDYKGRTVSVMGSGMGMPSIGIYSYELYMGYGVKNIIRIGSAGGIAEDVELYDIVAGMAACTNSGYAMQYGLPGTYAPIADYGLLRRTVDVAEEMGVPVKVGNLLSSDTFYDDADSLGLWKKMGVLAIEMEAAALYMNAARTGGRALAICTISDCPFKGTSTSAGERQNAFHRMMEVALETALWL